MTRFFPLLAVAALVAVGLSDWGVMAAIEAGSVRHPPCGYSAGVDAFEDNQPTLATIRPLALRPSRTRAEAGAAQLVETAMEPPPWRRFARRLEAVDTAAVKSTEGVAWSLTAAHRDAELRAARGRQSDP